MSASARLNINYRSFGWAFTMKQLPIFQQQLKEQLPREGISFGLRTLKEHLPVDVAKYNQVLQLEAEYRQVKMQRIEGTVGEDDLRRAEASLLKRLLELVDSLEIGDFDRQTRRSRVAPEQKIRRGYVLYRIPKRMQIQEESRCLVRIAFDKAMLIEDLDLDADTEFKGNVRLSDYMQVCLLDPSAEAAFEIRTTSAEVQLVDADDYTEWHFWVKPLQAGEHLLQLKVCIMLVVNGRETVREKTLEESVVIVSEAPEPEATFQRLDEAFVYADPVGLVAPSRFSVRTLGSQGMALALACLLFLSATTTYAFAPPDYRAWVWTHYWEHDLDAYRDFERQFPQSTFADNANWEAAQLLGQPEGFLAYRAKYPNTERAQRVETVVAQLEPKVWREVESNTSVPMLERYLRIYGETGTYRAAALDSLKSPRVWQAPEPEGLDTLVSKDMEGAYERLQPTVEAQESDRKILSLLWEQLRLNKRTGWFAKSDQKEVEKPPVESDSTELQDDTTTVDRDRKLNLFQQNPFREGLPKLLDRSGKSTSEDTIDENNRPESPAKLREILEIGSEKLDDLTTRFPKKKRVSLQGQSYTTIQFSADSPQWLAENLNYELPDSWCYEADPDNCSALGRLYTWEAAKTACAGLGDGWRLPTEAEWRTLSDRYGGADVEANFEGGKAAYSALIEAGQSGFSARLGGYRKSVDGSFRQMGRYGDYWTATSGDAEKAWSFGFSSGYQKLSRNYSTKLDALSCRCVRR